MGGLFKTPKAPAIPPPPAPASAPTVDVAKDRAMAMDKLAGRRGRAASILTGSQGDLTAAPTATKTLLGS